MECFITVKSTLGKKDELGYVGNPSCMVRTVVAYISTTLFRSSSTVVFL